MAAAKRPPRSSAAKAPAVGYSQRSRVDKLGVRPGARVAVIGVADPHLAAELASRTPDVSSARAKQDTDLILLGVNDPKPLARLALLQKSIKRDGAIWAIWPKGQPHIKEDTIRAAALKQGLVDVKVIAFSETLSGLKLVIPLAKR